MLPDFEVRLRAFAEVAVRVGVNLQPGQRLLIADPYELQGVARSAEVIVQAVESVAREVGGAGVAVIWGDGPRLREFAERADWRGFAKLVQTNAAQMRRHLDDGGAFLFLIGSQPRLLEGLPAANVSELHRIAWQNFGPIVQRLISGESQWSLVPAPSPAWATAAFADLPSEQRLAALWETAFESCRVGPLLAEAAHSAFASKDPAGDPVAAWRTRLAQLEQRRFELNNQRAITLRYQGDGTDLTVKLPAKHVWCTAAGKTRDGIAFVQNLPTEEVFTAPHKDSAEGTIRVSRPVNHGGALIDGIELQFKRGEVVAASARTGNDFLQRLLETDSGACRLGEVALVEPAAGIPAPRWQSSGRFYYHPLLDENTANHVALGEAYRFCLDSIFSLGLNRSLIHVDFPLSATATLAR